MKTMTSMAVRLAFGALLLVGWFAFATSPAYATWNNDDNGDQTQDQNQHQGQAQGQAQGQGQGQAQDQLTYVKTETTSQADSTAESTATSDASSYSEGSSAVSSSAGGSSSNEGNTIDASDHSSVENNSSNIVLVPNNNTEKCLRVWGVAWGKNGESGALGIPWRSAKCDFEQAADDAFAAGERESGWFWKCQNKNLYKRFKAKGESAESASQDCLDSMVGNITAMRTITTLTEQLETSEDLRKIERSRHEQLTEELGELCEESKDRIFAACTNK